MKTKRSTHDMIPTPRGGDVAWEVDWCTEIPAGEDGECQHTLATRCNVMCGDFESAMKHARNVYPVDLYGSVIVTQCEFKTYLPDDPPTVGYWEPISASHYYEGPDSCDTRCSM